MVALQLRRVKLNPMSLSQILRSFEYYALYWMLLSYLYYFIVRDSIDPIFVFMNKEHSGNLEEANTAYYICSSN